MTAITVNNLCKNYGANRVLKGISFSVNEGEIFAILGVNGAGKTTALECIEGLNSQTSGEIIVDTKSIGVQLQSSSLPENIKVFEAIKLFALWNRTNQSKELIARFGIGDISKKRYKELSTGQKRRLHLALAMVRNPNIIFLDEPTAGLDVEGRASLHEEIRKFKKLGKTVILASHDMAEVESLCDRLIMLKDGVIIFCGSVEEFTAQNIDKFKIHFKTDINGGYSMIETENIHAGLSEILQQNNNIIDIKIEKSTLEDSFLMVAKGWTKIE